jgi:hypothetical protein
MEYPAGVRCRSPLDLRPEHFLLPLRPQAALEELPEPHRVRASILTELSDRLEGFHDLLFSLVTVRDVPRVELDLNEPGPVRVVEYLKGFAASQVERALLSLGNLARLDELRIGLREILLLELLQDLPDGSEIGRALDHTLVTGGRSREEEDSVLVLLVFPPASYLVQSCRQWSEDDQRHPFRTQLNLIERWQRFHDLVTVADLRREHLAEAVPELEFAFVA